MNDPLDSQVIEIMGRNRLVNELLRAGIEVAQPIRDRGIDLIAYIERNHDVFVSVPIQMKAATARSFALDDKYKNLRNLLIVFVWCLGQPESASETYAMSYAQAVEIGDQMGYTKTASWSAGKYATTRPSEKLLGLMAPYRMSEQAWRARLMPQLAK